MFNSNEVLDYFMQPRTLSNGLKVYPIKLKDYDRFSELSMKYIVLNMEQINNRARQNHERLEVEIKFENLPFKNTFEWLIAVCSESIENKAKVIRTIKERNSMNEKILTTISNEELVKIASENPDLLDKLKPIKIDENTPTICDEVIELFELILRCKVVFDGTTFNLIGEYISIEKMDNFVFEEIRENTMEQNILHSPMIAPNIRGQNAIDRGINAYNMNNKGKPTSIASMISVVSCVKNLSDEDIFDYTYYRLKYDFEIINRMHMNNFVFMLRSQGSNEPISLLSEEVKLNKNPYDDIFGKVDKKKIKDKIIK